MNKNYMIIPMQENNSETAFIFKRSFLGFFWIIVFIPLFVAYFIFKSASPETLVTYNIGVENPYVIGGIIFYAIIGAIYAFIVGHTKYIERVIRLMSEKDSSKIMPAQSLLLSKKIFKDSVKFRLSLFCKYYWFISLVFIASFCVAIGTLYQFAFNETVSMSQTATVFAITAFIVLVGWIFIHFFLAAKTRFIWFTYISHFGENISNVELFSEVKRLNDVDTKDDKDAMLGYLKRDMAADAGSVITSSTVDVLVPKGLGSDVVKGYARGMAIDAAEYSKIKLNFAQYKEAYKKLFGKEPELSQKLLSL